MLCGADVIRRHVARRRLRTALPAALLALAFLGALVAAAPHSVHHIREEGNGRPVDCPGVLAWSSASGADCPQHEAGPPPPPDAPQLSPDSPDSLPLSRALTQPGRAPPTAGTF